jgi:hypothetical protein
LVIQTAARHAGRGGRAKTIELGSQRDGHGAPESTVLEGTVLSARQWRALGRRRNAVVVGIGLAAAANTLRNCRFNEQLILRVIVLAAVTRIVWKDLVRTFMRLIASENAYQAELKKELRLRKAQGSRTLRRGAL